jgi:hypothetical protein
MSEILVPVHELDQENRSTNLFHDLYTRLKVNNFSINRQIPAYTSYFDVAEFQIKCVNELDIYDVVIDKYTEQKKLNNTYFYFYITKHNLDFIA